MTPWSAAAIRDTTAAIVDAPAYRRELTRPLFERMLDWLLRQLRQLFELLPDVRVGPTILVVLAALLVLLLVLRTIRNLRAEREFRAGSPGAAGLSRRADSFAESERLAASGRYLEAAQHLCAALLAASSRRGEVTLHPSKTTGDYAREMRRRGAKSEPAFQRFRARYDRVVYDQHSCTADEFAALRAAARELLGIERAA